MNNRLEGTDVKKILVANILVRASKIIFHIFLNIFVWKLTEDISLIALFNITYLSLHLISFSFFAKIIKKGYRNLLHVNGLYYYL